MGLLKVKEALPLLRKLTGDESELYIWLEDDFTTLRVKDLAEEALRTMG
jgi:hypothetical protein